MTDDKGILHFAYVNYRGEFAVRQVIPRGVFISDSTHKYHKEQLVLQAYDLDKKDLREFACKDIHPVWWTPRHDADNSKDSSGQHLGGGDTLNNDGTAVSKDHSL